MNLKPQLQFLAADIPGRALSPEIVEQVIFPTLIPVAKRLGSSTFYAFVGSDHELITFTMAHNFKPDTQTRNVIIAFKSRSDALRYPDFDPKEMEVVQQGVIFLLMDLLTYPEVDAGFFYVQKGNLKQGVEITAQSLRQSLQQTQQVRGIYLPSDNPQLA